MTPPKTELMPYDEKLRQAVAIIKRLSGLRIPNYDLPCDADLENAVREILALNNAENKAGNLRTHLEPAISCFDQCLMLIDGNDHIITPLDKLTIIKGNLEFYRKELSQIMHTKGGSHE